MDAILASPAATAFRAPLTSIGNLSPDVAARVLAAAGDVSMVLDDAGVIRDVALGDDSLAEQGIGDWVDRRWIDTVTSDSRDKIGELLREAKGDRRARWRQVNHPARDGGTVPVRYLAVDGGGDGRVIAIGRDLRATAAMQQRLLQAQQSMERDYLRFRQAEQRYRALFEGSSEAVLIVDAAARRIVEANPAAQALAGGGLGNTGVAGLVDEASRDALAGLFGAAPGGVPVPLRLASGREALATASLFRGERGTAWLLRLNPLDQPAGQRADPRHLLLAAVERLPDAFVVTDASLAILAENSAFLELAGLVRSDQARGRALGEFLGRPGIDMAVLAAQLRDHGAVRNFATIMRDALGGEDEVEVAAVAVPDATTIRYGFSVRGVARRFRDAAPAGRALPRSVEQLTELVGRVSLKEIVRESTDLIERLCIEAALTYTADNRASAAEILGLSRQSLYSKLHRHGLGNLGNEAE